MRRTPAAALGVLAALAAATAGGCGGAGSGSELAVVPSPDYVLLGETLEDWVSYGDQLSTVTVLDETPPRTPPDFRNGGGLIGRTVTLRVDRTFWRRSRAAPTVRGTFALQTWGWMMESDQDPDSPRHPLVSDGTPRLEVGRRYLVVLVRLGREWVPVTDRAVMTLEDGVVTSEVAAGEPSPGARALKGQRLARAAAIVAATPPDPLAERYADLPPRARLGAVAKAGGLGP